MPEVLKIGRGVSNAEGLPRPTFNSSREPLLAAMDEKYNYHKIVSRAGRHCGMVWSHVLTAKGERDSIPHAPD